MKNKLIFLCMLVFILSVHAVPNYSLPLNPSLGSQIGSGTLDVVFSTGSFVQYDVQDVNLNVLLVKMQITNIRSYGNQPGFGSIQLYNGVNLINQTSYVAASAQDWSNVQTINTWYSSNHSSDYGYALTRPMVNGLYNDAGGVNDNYTMQNPGNSTGFICYYYVGFDSSVHVTSLKFGTGSNSDVTYNMTFYAFSTATVPEPASWILMLVFFLYTIVKKNK
ncbi:MAG: hypothetical protein HUU50_13710 [Candidatus Brocadiae bacterium]|nr:hypothetical protein [Candidatus Brocadiia bacterium]